MNKSNRKYTTFLLIITALMIALFLSMKPSPPTSLTLQFNATVNTATGDEPLVFNQFKYPNPGGKGQFKIRAFQFYLSNIQLVGDNGNYTEPDSYHLVRFDGAKPSYAITLQDIPNDNYHSLSFAIGIDSTANKSIINSGDLNPNSRMAWSWNVGYKFVLLEGRLGTSGKMIPLVYHIGFDENHKTRTVKLEPSLFNSSTASLNFTVDPMKLFTGHQTIGLAALPSVKFDRADAKMIADNYQSMIMLD